MHRAQIFIFKIHMWVLFSSLEIKVWFLKIQAEETVVYISLLAVLTVSHVAHSLIEASLQDLWVAEVIE